MNGKIEKGEEKAVPLGNGEEVRLLKDGSVELVRIRNTEHGTEENRTKVIMGRFKPVRKLELDGETVFEVETGRLVRGNAEEVHQHLRREGMVVNHRAQNCVNALFQGLDLPVEKGHAALGVFNSDGKGAELCLEPLPRTESQEQIRRQADTAIKTELTLDTFLWWTEVLQFWHPDEVLPAMGLSVMAPFALELRRRGIVVGYLYHLSPESGLGKTKVAYLFSRCLFGNELLSADAVNSPYRLMDALDSAGLPIVVNEAEALRWERFSPHLQTAAEQPLQSRRGTRDLGSRPYWSRAVPFFTGNYFPTKRKALLLRTLVVEFDRTKLGERRRRDKELEEVVGDLSPIGFRIVEAELESLGNSMDELVRRIYEHAARIKKLYPGTFQDSRRPILYAIVYEGLKAWELAAIKVGVSWRAPSYEEFVDQVVNKVEPVAFQSVEVPATAFISWWRGWKALYSMERDGRAIIKGEGEIWRRETCQGVEGDAVTQSVLGFYERDCQRRGTIPINSLPDLARGIEALYSLPLSAVYKDRKFGKKALKSVFIPDSDILISPATSQPADSTGTGGGLRRENHSATDPTGTESGVVAELRPKTPPA